LDSLFGAFILLAISTGALIDSCVDRFVYIRRPVDCLGEPPFVQPWSREGSGDRLVGDLGWDGGNSLHLLSR
jgi:hypothetical protein